MAATTSDKLEQQLGPPPQRQHFWEDAVFRDIEVPDHCRDGFRYRGLPAGIWGAGASRRPLLLASVKGDDHEGHPFSWHARRHRKRVAHPHECPTPRPPVNWLGCLNVRRHAANMSWWVALAFTVGSILFVVSGVAAEVTAVGNPAADPPGLTSLAAAFIGWPNLVAANACFFSGGLLQLLESANMDWDSRLRAWKKAADSTAMAQRPRRRLLPTGAMLRTMSWWAVAVQVVGMLGFNMATIAQIISMGREIQPLVIDWTVNFGFTLGGALFTVSAVMFGWEATGSWWRGLIPSRLADLRSISWHSVFWNFHGSVGFLIAGAATYADSFSWTQQQWIMGYGSLGGAVWFLLSSVAMLMEQANPQHP